MSTEPIIAYFSKILPLDPEEIKVVKNVFQLRQFKRRQFMLQAGDLCKYNSFVVEGCFRMYMVDDQGKEHNLQFAVENWWMIDMESFYKDTPSKLNIEALEDATVLQITKEDQLKLYVEYPKFNRIFRVLAENALMSLQRRVLHNISSTAEERYLHFMKHYPYFFNRISNVQIASYLGVTPEFLSTIRKKIVKP